MGVRRAIISFYYRVFQNYRPTMAFEKPTVYNPPELFIKLLAIGKLMLSCQLFSIQYVTVTVSHQLVAEVPVLSKNSDVGQPNWEGSNRPLISPAQFVLSQHNRD